ncbi:MAG: hypothetical protein KIT27_02770 [Legionellales bacterium]|nr:hypothetical protein [Legionellales bacterium]
MHYKQFLPQYWFEFTSIVMLSLILIVIINTILFFRTITTTTAPINRSTTPTQPTYSAENIAHFHVFGISPQSALPQTNLNIRLIGVMSGKNAQAIIQLENGQQQVYSIGDHLANGAIIEQIQTSAVILNYQGHLQRLDLPELKLQFAPIWKGNLP